MQATRLCYTTMYAYEKWLYSHYKSNISSAKFKCSVAPVPYLLLSPPLAATLRYRSSSAPAS